MLFNNRYTLIKILTTSICLLYKSATSLHTQHLYCTTVGYYQFLHVVDDGNLPAFFRPVFKKKRKTEKNLLFFLLNVRHFVCAVYNPTPCAGRQCIVPTPQRLLSAKVSLCFNVFRADITIPRACERLADPIKTNPQHNKNIISYT